MSAVFNKKIEWKKVQQRALQGDCPICLNIMVEPCKLPCDHYLCVVCLHRVMNQKVECQCPIDRQDIVNCSPTIDFEMQAKIKKAYPEQYIAFEKELSQKNLLIGDKIFLEFEVGNTFKEVTENIRKSKDGYECKYSWTSFVRLADSNLD